MKGMKKEATKINYYHFNPFTVLPYGLTTTHIYQSMVDFLNCIEIINESLQNNGFKTLQELMTPASFSDFVGEFIIGRLPLYCSTLAKNSYHNGHPDLLPKDLYPQNSCQYGTEGIEIKASKNKSGWQGHNPEAIFLMVFVYNCIPFSFKNVIAGQLSKEDWNFYGRSETSRRTPNATVLSSGIKKMKDNWVYENVTDEANLTMIFGGLNDHTRS